MPYNDIMPRGQPKSSTPDAGGAVLRSLPVLATVKNNVDPTRSGRLEVYIGDMSGNDPNSSSNWVTVNYMTPFFGSTQASAQKTGSGEYIRNPSSYGLWNSPPDIGSTVICIFINGDPNFGFYIGCVPDPDALHMVPAIGGAENVILNPGEAGSLGGATRLPVTNLNSNNENVATSNDFLSTPKPVHSYVASILSQQGLVRDPIRGVIGSSAQRESPSRVGWGVSTPGRPIYEGGYTDDQITDAINTNNSEKLNVIARRGGHSIVMDDGNLLGTDQLIRIRTALGHQILMSDDGQTLFIIHSNGQSWIELGKEGTIDMYATNSVNVRTQGDLNLHADNNININAKKNFNIVAENINVQTEKDFTQRVGGKLNLYSQAQYTVKVSGPMSLNSSGEASFASSSTTFINGSKINLNTGSASLAPQEVKPIPIIAHTDALFDNSKGWLASPGSLLSIVSRAPTHQPYAMANKGVDVTVNNNASAALPSPPPTAVTQANTTAANSTTPQSVPPATTPVTSTVPSTTSVSNSIDKGTASTMVAQTAVIAATGPAKEAISQGSAVVETDQGLVAAIGKLAQTPTQLQDAGYLKPGSASLVDNIVSGGGSIDSAMTPNMFTGKDGVNNLADYTKNIKVQVNTQVTNFQQAQTQLTQSGIITGTESSTQISGVVMSTAFNGLNNTATFIRNASFPMIGTTPRAASINLGRTVSGVVGSVVTGALSESLGKNSASAIGGVVSRAIVGSVTGAIGGAIGVKKSASNSLMGSPQNLIAGGLIAATLSNNLTGSISAIGGSLTPSIKNIGVNPGSLLDNTKGAAASAFSAIVNSIPSLQSGKPQNLKEIASAAAISASLGAPYNNVNRVLSGIAGSAASNALRDSLGIAASRVIGSTVASVISGNATANNVDRALTGAVGSAVSTALSNRIGGDAARVIGGLTTTAISGTIAGAINRAKTISGSATGLSGIPGVDNAVSAVVDNQLSSLNQIPGVSQVAGLIKEQTVPNILGTGTNLPNNLGSNLLNTSNGLKGEFATGLNDLTKGKNSLADLAALGLSPSASAALNSAISSISSTGVADIKMPVAALNTTNRSEITAQLTAQLGNPKIPAPNFSGISIANINAQTTALEKTTADKKARRAEVTQQLDIEKATLMQVRKEYQNAIDSYPPGDEKIVELREKYYAQKEKVQQLINLID
jgi:hypothetical protein